VIEIVETDAFRRWMVRLNDAIARNRIVARIKRASMGNLGDWKSVGGGVAEMRIDHGPGHRVYFHPAR
jgi:putative addiction module killer protein